MSGRLFIIATPVGNLGDLTERAKTSLATCELILAEDTRVTIKLLNHLGLKKRMVSCHDFNEAERASLLEELNDRNADVALVSDAGTPLVSDPGHQIVSKAIEIGMRTVPVPGPSAFLLALVASGLPCRRFIFEGFLPENKGDRKRHLQALALEPRTMVFYVAPHDLARTVDELRAALGNRRVCLARELTKLYEEFLRGSLEELAATIRSRQLKGECVLVIEGAPEAPAGPAARQEVERRLTELLRQGERLKDAAVQVAKLSGWSRSDVYRLGLELNRGDSERQY